MKSNPSPRFPRSSACAQEQRLPVAAGHAPDGGNQRGGPDIVAVEDAVAGGLEVHIVEPVGQLRRLDEVSSARGIAIRTPSPSRGHPGWFDLAVSLQAIRVIEDVVDPLFQVVKDEQAVLFPHGLLDVLEAGGAQDFDDLDIPDLNQVGDPFGQDRADRGRPNGFFFRAFCRAMGSAVSRTGQSILIPLAPRWIVFWASAAERMPPAARMENRCRSLLLHEETMDSRHRVGRRIVALLGIVIGGQTKHIKWRVEEGLQRFLKRRGRPQIGIHIFFSDLDDSAEDRWVGKEFLDLMNTLQNIRVEFDFDQVETSAFRYPGGLPFRQRVIRCQPALNEESGCRRGPRSWSPTVQILPPRG